MVRRAPGKERRRVAIMLSWISHEFLQVWWPTKRISHEWFADGLRLLPASCPCPVSKLQLHKYSLPRHFLL